LTLPWLIRKLALDINSDALPLEKQEIIIQKKLAQYSLQYLDEKDHNGWPQNEYLNNLQTRLTTELNYFSKKFEETDSDDSTLAHHQQLSLEVLEHQRSLLQQMNQHAEFDEELIRKYLSLIDLEEYKLRERLMK
jgi:CPA1 family monovalent cation:H+ antiporter